MSAQPSQFTRLLPITMGALCVLSLVAFSYANWMANSEPLLWMLALNALILAIPLFLFYGAAYLLIAAGRKHRLNRQINLRLVKLFHLGHFLIFSGLMLLIAGLFYDWFVS